MMPYIAAYTVPGFALAIYGFNSDQLRLSRLNPLAFLIAVTFVVLTWPYGWPRRIRNDRITRSWKRARWEPSSAAITKATPEDRS